jgi:phage I-like protein
VFVRLNDNLYALKSGVKASADEWQIIGVTGEWRGHSIGAFAADDLTFAQMVANYTRQKIAIVVDYEHQTLYGGAAPAAGWIEKEPISLKAENGNLYAKIKWTDEAKKRIEADEYRYLSPVFDPNYIDPVSGASRGWALHSVALTNKPFLEELFANKSKNQPNNKEDRLNIEELTAALEAEKSARSAAESELARLKDEAAEALVDNAIKERGLKPENRDSYLKLCKNDPEAFAHLLEGLGEKPRKTDGDNLYAGKSAIALPPAIDYAKL